MASQGPGRRRTPNRTAVTPEEDALNVIAREAEARLAAKRAARAEAREIRMKELERQQKEEDSERYTRHSERHVSVSDDEDCMSLGSKTSVRLSHTSLFNSHKSTKKKKKKMKISSDISNGNDNDYRTNSSRGSLYENSLSSTSLRSSSHTLSEYSGILVSSTRASSRASSRCASPVENSSSSVASFLRKAGSSSGLRDLDHVTVPDLPNLDDGLDRDFFEKGSSRASTLSTATLTSLGGASSRKGSGSSSVTADTETSLQDIKEIHELKDQIQDVEAKYMQSLKELKDSLSEMEEKYRKAMVSNAQFDNEKSNLMYEVDTLKDSLIELEELLAETRRECEEKSKDLEREKHAHSILQFQFNEQKETLKQSEELLTEIRQLHVKQDSFVREISDLQETIEWKDKKIGALEKQKVYSDAIRNERDELRDEVVQLKDILKKHGIVLGPDLCANGEVEGNVSGGSASSELQHGSSVLGTQELQLFRDENIGSPRGGQFQHPQEFDHGVQENHLPPSASASSSESPVVAQYVDGGLVNDLNDSIEKIQNNIEKPQTVFEAEAGEQVGGCIMEDMRTDQQEIPLYNKINETIKEGNHDSTENFPTETSEKDIGHLDETVIGDSQIKTVPDSSPSAKIDTINSSKSASVSGKRKKKKKKNKQKQKQISDEKAVHSEMGDEIDNQLTESSYIQTVEENTVCSEEAIINEKVPDSVNVDEKIGLMCKGAESEELQSPKTGPGNILGPIINQTDGTDSIRTVDSKTEIKIDVPTYDSPLDITTGEFNASVGKYKILSNTDDTELKDIVTVCADFPKSGCEFKPEKEEIEPISDVIKMEAGEEIIHFEETSTLAETSTDTQLDDAVVTADAPEKKEETSSDMQLDDAVVTDKVPENKEEETSSDTQLDGSVITADVLKKEQETSTDTQLDDAVVTPEALKKEQVTYKDTQLNALVTEEVAEMEQKISTVTQVHDAVVTVDVPETEQETSIYTQLDDALVTEVVSEKEQETSTDTQLNNAVATDEVAEETQETYTETQLDGALVTEEVAEKEQETSTDTQLDGIIVTEEVAEKEQKTSKETQLDGALVTEEVAEKEQETSTDTQLNNAVATDEVAEETQKSSTDTQLNNAVATDEVAEETQKSSTDTQLGSALVTVEVAEKEQESKEPTHLVQEFKVEQDETEFKYGESFELNIDVMRSEGNLLRDPECHQEHIIPGCAAQNCTTSKPQELSEDGHEDRKQQTDEQNISTERDEGVTVEHTAPTGGNHNKSQQQSLTGYEEQGFEGHEEMVPFDHSERDKQETSPANVGLQETGQNMREQEIRDVKEGACERNKEDAKNGSKKEIKKGKGKSKEDCKMS
ncbi:A-kinase anchor protein 12 isoform X10 [Tachysurus vachellii]|uniref:A-kinase anchor protein 12 isoform X10 n=1 Tax=Tachysurus vachellii TaxID=175792 RepID=UPI00296A9B7A|nr:A-kinase anchor protein 12 isoform X10 [Tachysurus vachellii]